MKNNAHSKLRKSPAQVRKRPENPFMTGKTLLFFAIVTIVIVGSIIYSNSFNCGFQFDDYANIRDNPAIKNLSNVSAWWNYVPSRPLGTMTFALNYHFNKLDVWGYHFVNLIIHLINSILILLLVISTINTPRIKSTPVFKHRNLIALFAALLFLTHPLQTQAVTYIVQRLASLATMFYILSLLFYVNGRESQTRKKSIVFFVLSALAALLGMMTKENTFTLPVIILLYEFTFIRTNRFSISFRDWKIWAFAGIILIGILLFLKNFNLTIFNDIKPEQGHTYTITAYTYLLTQFRVLTTYLRLLLLPLNQNLDYDYAISTGFFELKTLFSFLMLLGIVIAGILLYRKFRLLSFGIFWFFITSIIESSFIPIPNVIFEHRTYLTGIGFFIFLPVIVFYLSRKNIVYGTAFLLIIIVVNSFLTFERNKVWKTEMSLWTDVVKKSPHKSRPLHNLGLCYYYKGNIPESIKWYNESIKYNPDWAEPQYDLGVSYLGLQDYVQALKCFNRAIETDTTNFKAYNNRALIRIMNKDTLGAYNDLNAAIQARKDFGDAWLNRGKMKYFRGDKNGGCADMKVADSLGKQEAKDFLQQFCGK
ncbi:MAG: tetratricopeptide repeat protein [Bacteroidota bacterium]